MKDITSSLSEDGQQVRIEIMEDGEALAHIDMDAGMLSMVISALAVTRASMAEKVPEKMEPGKVRIEQTQINPATYIGNEGPMSKRFVLGLRHPGYGWLGFGWNESNGQKVTALMMQELMRIGTMPSGLISPSGRKL